MESISISKLKANLCAEIKMVRQGINLVVLDHKRPVAILSPYKTEPFLLHKAEKGYKYKELSPITDIDPCKKLREEREDRW